MLLVTIFADVIIIMIIIIIPIIMEYAMLQKVLSQINLPQSMVIPEYNDGKSDDHPDLIRDARSATEVVDQEKKDTRKGGQAEAEPKAPQRIIVDMREFRSELPALIHKRGIEIDPVTIEVCFGRCFFILLFSLGAFLV